MLKRLVRVTAALCLVVAALATGQNHPGKPIIMVVPFAAGGPTAG